jgi:hypothetical protein
MLDSIGFQSLMFHTSRLLETFIDLETKCYAYPGRT